MQTKSGIGSVGTAYLRAAKAAAADAAATLAAQKKQLETGDDTTLRARATGFLEAKSFSLDVYSKFIGQAEQTDDASSAAVAMRALSSFLRDLPTDVLGYVRELPEPNVDELLAKARAEAK